MEDIVKVLRTNFLEITDIYSTFVENRDRVSEKVATLKGSYNELLKQNPQPMFLLCLESLFFQYKILYLELENYQKTGSMIQNRMYGDYYKLYNTMTNYCKETVIDISNADATLGEAVLPTYKDIDPFFKYRMEDVSQIHERILSIVDAMTTLSIKKTENIQHHRNNVLVGYSLNIFLHALEHENTLLKAQTQLYVNCINFYHTSQKAYLTKIVKKIEDFIREMDDAILLPNPPVETVDTIEQPNIASLLADTCMEFSEEGNDAIQNEYEYENDDDDHPQPNLVLGELLRITVPPESDAAFDMEQPPAITDDMVIDEFANMVVDDEEEGGWSMRNGSQIYPEDDAASFDKDSLEASRPDRIPPPQEGSETEYGNMSEPVEETPVEETPVEERPVEETQGGDTQGGEPNE